MQDTSTKMYLNTAAVTKHRYNVQNTDTMKSRRSMREMLAGEAALDEKPAGSLRMVPPMFRIEAQFSGGSLLILGFRLCKFVCDVSVRSWIVIHWYCRRGRGHGRRGKKVGESVITARESQQDDEEKTGEVLAKYMEPKRLGT